MRSSFFLILATLSSLTVVGAATPPSQELPETWIDKDTGHRIRRITNEPGSSGFYFNVNAYSPDGKLMAYDAPDGIRVLELSSFKSRLLVPSPPRQVHPIVVGRKTNTVFFSKLDAATKLTSIYKADMYSGEVTKLVTLPPRASVASINADETLGVGTYNESEQPSDVEYGQNHARPNATRQAGNLVQAEDKAEMMERRLAARIPVVLYTINLKTGRVATLLHSTDWIGHMLFSPVDPDLLMYCHEGPWQKVDRIWMIHSDGTNNTLIHKRTMAMEIAGHEFWGLDGESIWYDWQYPESEDFFLAGLDLKTRQRTAFHLQRNEWSIHFNLTEGNALFTGDGGDPGQIAKAPDGEWIELFHPEMLKAAGALNDPNFFQPGIFRSEHLVNMAHHDYHLEPNVRFSPDQKFVFFTSNMLGPSYIFAVETARTTNPAQSELKSTPELAKTVNPRTPRNTDVPAPELVPVQPQPTAQ